jgi:hypothetical protein
MSTDTQNLPTHYSSGKKRVIHGVLVRCNDGVWQDRDGIPVPPGTKLLVVGVTRVIQCWQDQEPTDTIFEEPGEDLPDVDELNAAIPQSEWELGFDGQPKAPWQLQQVVYMIDVSDAQKFTFASGTIGARIAAENLKDRMLSMKILRGADVVPLVELTNKPMKTRYGSKLRPDFRVVDWRELSEGSAPKQVEHKPAGKPVSEPTREEELRDSIRM